MRDNSAVSTEPEQHPEPVDANESVKVTIRRAPKLWVFLALGIIIGILAALVLTTVFEVDPAVGATGTFAYLALYAIPLAVALSIGVALLLDRASRRRARTVSAVHERASDADSGADAETGTSVEMHGDDAEPVD